MIENPIVQQDIDFFIEHFPFAEHIKEKTFLVTGATGLIGSILIKCLLRLNQETNLGIKIVAVARNKQKVHDLFGDCEIQWIWQDMTEPLDLSSFDIHYIIHCASPTSSQFYVNSPVETINTAFIGTRQLLEYAALHPSMQGMVYLSSLESYGTIYDDTVLVTEEVSGYINPIDVRSSYSLGKRMVECLCHAYASEYHVPVVMARLTQVFGAGVSTHDTRVFAQFAKSIINGKDIVMHTKGESAKPYCYTIDAINALFYLLLKGESGKVYNVATPNTYISICDLAHLLVEKFNNSCRVVIEAKDNMGYAPVTKLNLSTEKLETLGWKPFFRLEEMFGRLINYYKSIQ